MNPSTWQWPDYAFLAGLFGLVFVCGLMASRRIWFDLGRISAFREMQERRRRPLRGYREEEDF